MTEWLVLLNLIERRNTLKMPLPSADCSIIEKSQRIQGGMDFAQTLSKDTQLLPTQERPTSSYETQPYKWATGFCLECIRSLFVYTVVFPHSLSPLFLFHRKCYFL